MDFTPVLASQFNLQNWQVEKVTQLLDEGNTIPFIARYRKEAHGSLDDQTIRALSEKLEALRNLEKRPGRSACSHCRFGCSYPEISAALDKAATLSEIDDIYGLVVPTENAGFCGKGKGAGTTGKNDFGAEAQLS